jgi:hypothetical protein
MATVYDLFKDQQNRFMSGLTPVTPVAGEIINRRAASRALKPSAM